MRQKLSCGKCWSRALSLAGLSAIVLASATLHCIDPSHIEGLGLPRWAAYLIAAIEFCAVALLWFSPWAAPAQSILAGILAGAIGLYLRTGQYELIVLPAIPLLLLGALRWLNRPAMSCSCHHSAARESDRMAVRPENVHDLVDRSSLL